MRADSGDRRPYKYGATLEWLESEDGELHSIGLRCDIEDRETGQPVHTITRWLVLDGPLQDPSRPLGKGYAKKMLAKRMGNAVAEWANATRIGVG